MRTLWTVIALATTAACGNQTITYDGNAQEIATHDTMFEDLARLDTLTQEAAVLDTNIQETVVSDTVVPLDSSAPVDGGLTPWGTGALSPDTTSTYGCDIGNGVYYYVNATAAVNGNGGRNAPFRTISQALSAVQPGQQAVICIAEGMYTEHVGSNSDTFSRGTSYSLVGGFEASSNYTRRDPSRFVATVRAPDRTASAITFGNVRSIVVTGLAITNGSHGIEVVGGYSAGRSATVVDCHIYDNGLDGASGHQGAGMLLSGGTVVVARNLIEHNTGGRLGAGIFIGSSPRVESNQKDVSTGSLTIGTALATVVDNVVRANTLRYDTAHGVGIGVSMNCIVAGNIVEDNIGYPPVQGAGGEAVGGGIFVQGQYTTAIVLNNTVQRNRALHGGSGVFIDEAAIATVANNLLAYNEGLGALTVDGRAGGQNSEDRGYATFVNNTVVHNTDGAIYTQDSTASLYNNLFYANGTADIVVATGGAVSELVVGDYNCTRGTRGNLAAIQLGTHNIETEPLFVDDVNGDFRQLPNSPCLDRGTATFTPAFDYPNAPRSPPDRDLIGTMRSSHAIDLGAYELLSP